MSVVEVPLDKSFTTDIRTVEESEDLVTLEIFCGRTNTVVKITMNRWQGIEIERKLFDACRKGIYDNS